MWFFSHKLLLWILCVKSHSHILVGHVINSQWGGNKWRVSIFIVFVSSIWHSWLMTKWRGCPIVITIWLKNDYKSFNMNIDKPTPHLLMYLPTHTSVNLPTYLLKYLPTHLPRTPTYLPIYLNTHLIPHPPIYLLPKCQHTHAWPTYLPTHPFTYLPIHPATYLLQLAYLFTLPFTSSFLQLTYHLLTIL